MSSPAGWLRNQFCMILNWSLGGPSCINVLLSCQRKSDSEIFLNLCYVTMTQEMTRSKMIYL